MSHTPDRRLGRLRDAILAAHLALIAVIQALSPDTLAPPLQAATLWSLVHGFAMLRVERRLDRMIPGDEMTDSLLDAVLAAIRLVDD